MRRLMGLFMVSTLLAAGVGPAGAQQKSTLDKIGETGTLTIGTRTGSPPFGYVNAKNEWVGFSIDLVEELIKPALEKKLGKTIKVEKKESTPPTRIPLLSSGAVDLIAETMTDTRTRRDSVDFSLTYFVTGAQFLVKKGSPIKGIKNIDGKRIAAQQGSTNARIIREKAPKAVLREFPDQPAAFQALAQGQVDAYTNDGIQLAGLKAKAPESGPVGHRGRLLLLRALRHGDAQGRVGLQERGQLRPDGRHRVGQVLRDLRQVVRHQGRAAVSDGRPRAQLHAPAGRPEVGPSPRPSPQGEGGPR